MDNKRKSAPKSISKRESASRNKDRSSPAPKDIKKKNNAESMSSLLSQTKKKPVSGLARKKI
jgi:hypothetical protein